MRVAADWQPEGWQADYDSLTREQAEVGVVDAREALADLHRIQAIGELELAEAQQAKAALPGIEREIEDVQASLRELRGERAGLGIEQLEHEHDDAIRRHRECLIDVATTHKCPKCETPLMIAGGKIVAKSSKAIARRDNDMQSAQDDIAKIEDELTARRVHVQQAEERYCRRGRTDCRIEQPAPCYGSASQAGGYDPRHAGAAGGTRTSRAGRFRGERRCGNGPRRS